MSQSNLVSQYLFDLSPDQIVRVLNLMDKVLENRTLGKKKVKAMMSAAKGMIAQSDDYKKTFTIKSWIQAEDKVSNVINEKFSNANIDSSAFDELGIKISGEDYHYKRTLDSDLSKILSNL